MRAWRQGATAAANFSRAGRDCLYSRSPFMILRRLLSSLALIGGLAAPAIALAAPLVIDGSILTNTCPGGTVVSGGAACQYSGTVTFDSVELKNGAVIFVKAYDGSGDKSASGNLVLKSLSSISIDKSSRIEAKGRGYQRALCANGAGPLAFPLSGGRGGCAVFDSGGGAAHVGPGGRGTKDNPAPAPAITGFEEACASTFDGTKCIGDGTSCRNNDALPTVAGIPFYHNILTPEFGPAGGDKGCGDGDGRAATDIRAGSGGGRIVLFAANAAQDGLLKIEGRISSDGDRGCSRATIPRAAAQVAPSCSSATTCKLRPARG